VIVAQQSKDVSRGDIDCRSCIAVLRAESVDQRGVPHPFVHSGHCVECNLNDPVRAFRRDQPSWNGRW
jgi:hypothetical protein